MFCVSGMSHTEEQVICIGTVAANLENLNQVEELAVDVADDGDGGLDVHDVALAHEQLLGFGADGFDDGLGEQFFLVEARDALVQVDGSWSSQISLASSRPVGAGFDVFCLPGSPGIVAAGEKKEFENYGEGKKPRKSFIRGPF